MNKILCGVCAAAIVATIGLTGAMAVSANTEVAQTAADVSDMAAANKNGKGKEPLTEEKKAEREAMKAACSAAREKWASLTDEQKQEIYALQEQSIALQNETIDKYVELGVMDENTAAAMKERLAKKQAEMKENGNMPMMGNGGRGRGRHGGSNTPSETTSSDTTADTAA